MMSTGRVYFQNGPLMSCYSYNFACTNQQTVEIRRSSLIPLQTTRQSLGQRPCSINEVSNCTFFHALSMYHQTVFSATSITGKPGNVPVAATAWNNLNPSIHVALVLHTTSHNTRPNRQAFHVFHQGWSAASKASHDLCHKSGPTINHGTSKACQEGLQICQLCAEQIPVVAIQNQRPWKSKL